MGEQVTESLGGPKCAAAIHGPSAPGAPSADEADPPGVRSLFQQDYDRLLFSITRASSRRQDPGLADGTRTMGCARALPTHTS